MRRGVRVIHGVTAVAELKRQCIIHSLSAVGVIHGVTAVAELKPLDRIAGLQREWGHPRRHRRGRIEARCVACASNDASGRSSTASPPWPN